MKPEAKAKNAIVDAFQEGGHYARRFEDQFYVGFPDMILIPRGYPAFFTEAKIVDGLQFKPRLRQWVELDRLSLSPKHVIPTMLGVKAGVHYLHKFAKIVHIVDCVKQRDGEHIVDLFKRYYHERMEL
jgi:hypothetical protein